MTKFLARPQILSINRGDFPKGLNGFPMHVTRLADAQPYDAPRHAGVHSLRLQGAEATPARFCSVGLSYYLPGGRAEMSAGPQEKVYVMIEGELVVELADGSRTVLRPLDSCLIEAGESREVRNETNAPATLLVAMALPTSV